MKMNCKITGVIVLLVAGLVCAEQQGDDQTGLLETLTSLDEQLLPIEAEPFQVGGAFRFNYSYRDFDPFYSDTGQFDLDTIRINIDLVGAEPWIGAAEYRWYIPRSFGSYSFLKHAWIGYELTETDQVHAGLNQVPFGLLPYASHNWFFQLPYYVGLEDSHSLGVKYITDQDPWNVQLGYYPRDGGSWQGQSQDSSRYTYNIVRSDALDSFNKERHQFNARVAYNFEHSEQARSELGFSAQYGLIRNEQTRDFGDHFALAGHLESSHGPWGAKLSAIRYEYDLENPPGITDNVVVMGAYDAPYRVAAKGTILLAGISRDIPVDFGPIESVTVYNDYSVLFKDRSGFGNTYQNVVGMSFSAGRFFVYVDAAAGKRHPWLGGSYTNALADNQDASDGWQTRFNINIGYYF